MNILGRITSHKRKQDCLLLTEDGRILEIRLPVVRGYVAEKKTEEAWGLYPDARIPKRGSSRLAQVLTERDMAPLSLNEQGGSDKQHAKRSEEEVRKIAGESAAEERAGLQKKSLKSKTAETVQLVVLILCATLAVLVLAGLFMSGKLSIGGGGSSIFSQIPIIFGFFALRKGKRL